MGIIDIFRVVQFVLFVRSAATAETLLSCFSPHAQCTPSVFILFYFSYISYISLGASLSLLTSWVSSPRISPPTLSWPSSSRSQAVQHKLFITPSSSHPLAQVKSAALLSPASSPLSSSPHRLVRYLLPPSARSSQLFTSSSSAPRSLQISILYHYGCCKHANDGRQSSPLRLYP